MTAAAREVAPAQEIVRAFRTALGPHLDRQLNTTQAVVALVYAAVTNHGWTPQALARECARDIPADSANPGSLVTYRLRKAATHPPVGRAVTTAKRPLCGRCEDGWQVDPETRKPTARCDCRKATP